MNDFWMLGAIAALFGTSISLVLVIAVLSGERGRLRNWYWTGQWASTLSVLPFGVVYLVLGFPEDSRFLFLIGVGPVLVWGVCLWFAKQRVDISS